MQRLHLLFLLFLYFPPFPLSLPTVYSFFPLSFLLLSSSSSPPPPPPPPPCRRTLCARSCRSRRSIRLNVLWSSLACCRQCHCRRGWRSRCAGSALSPRCRRASCRRRPPADAFAPSD